MEVLAVVPARGGSKGLPRKNVAPFLGRPLVVWSVDAARDAQLVTRVVVSTDDAEIAEIASANGAEVPFVRPAELAADDVRDLPVFEHALGWLREHEGYVPDVVVHLRPTSPLRPAGLVDQAIQLLLDEPRAESVRAVCEAPCNPYKMWRITDGVLAPLLDSDVPEHWNAPRQALPTVHWQIGTVDAIRTATIVSGHSMSGDVIVPLVVDPALAGDIDDQWSFESTERMAVRLGLAGSAG
jgi:N-acylneuraminate cytidylyltransferase